MEANKKRTIISKLEQIVEKPALIKLVEEHVKLSEIENLLKANSSSTNEKMNTSSATKKKKEMDENRSNDQQNITPEQLRKQAEMMRKDPGMVRRAQPAFASMTDEQIRSYADQLEQAAKDPMMMKEVQKMSKLSNSERVELQSIQEGLSGIKPMNSAWVHDTVKSFKTHPDIFKTMFQGKAVVGGFTDEQVGGFIDRISKMDENTLRRILQWLIYLGSFYPYIMSAYQYVDSYTIGNAKYIVGGLVVLFLYLGIYMSWIVMKYLGIKLYTFIQTMRGVTNQSVSSPIEAVNSIPSMISKVATASNPLQKESILGAASLGQREVVNSAATSEKMEVEDEFEF